MKLNRIVVNREPALEPQLAVPRTAAEAEPWPAHPDQAPTTTAHRANRLRGWVAYLWQRHATGS